MDSMKAYMMGQANRGNPLMVFDWCKAARLIKGKNPDWAGAGLCSDWEYTGGTIWADGKPVKDDYTYLASTWATPELDLDGEIIDCCVMEDETEWGSDTKWPPEALAILEGEDE